MRTCFVLALAAAALQAADELIDESAERTLVGNATLDTLRDGLAALGAFLRVAIRGARSHRANRAHAAIGFECPTLIQNCFAGRLLGSGKKSSGDFRSKNEIWFKSIRPFSFNVTMSAALGESADSTGT